MSAISRYLALLTINENNLRVFHWTVSGCNFMCAHNLYKEYYEKLGEFMDETAEVMMSLGERPLGMKQVLDSLVADDTVNVGIANPDEDCSESFCTKAIIQIFNDLYAAAAALADDDSLPDDVQDVFMAHAKWYRVEGTYKLARLNTDPSRT